jgi:hypothetical protein
MVECTKRLIAQRDVGIVNSCNIDVSFTLYFAGLLPKRSPFLDGRNRLLRQCLEGGLFDKLWADMVSRAHLQSMGKIELLEDTTGTYFVFEIRHLTAAFVILTLCHILSCTVFVLEIIHKRLSVRRHQLQEVGQRHPNF